MFRVSYPFIIIMAMVTWSVLHSWLAAFSTKRMVQRLIGKGALRYYRLGYIVAAGLTLLPILAMVLVFPAQVLWRIPAPWLYFSLALQGLALVGLVLSVLQVDSMAFIGLRQLRDPDVEAKNELVTRGFYRWVRHPLYFFSLVLLWLLPIMTDLTLAFIITGSLYFIIGTFPEEQKLVETYGETYRQYQQEVPRLIPGLKLFKKR